MPLRRQLPGGWFTAETIRPFAMEKKLEHNVKKIHTTLPSSNTIGSGCCDSVDRKFLLQSRAPSDD